MKATALVTLSLLSSGACNVQLADSDPPRRARVVVTSTTGVEASLLASLDFVVEAGGSVNTGSADPSLVALPFEESYDMLDPPRLFIRITPPDSSTLEVSLEVLFDGERFSSQTGTIGTAELPDMEFLYRYSRPTF